MNWMSRQPAELVGLAGRKGRLAPGCDADLIVFDPETSFTVEPASLFHRHQITPYAGLTLQGTVQTTFLRGRRIYESGQVVDTAAGQMLLHGRDVA